MTMTHNMTSRPDAANHADAADSSTSDDSGPSRRTTQTHTSPRPTAPPPSCALIDATRRLPPDALAWLADHSQRAMTHLHLLGEIRARIVDDSEMTEAHRRHCAVDGTTDVITFDLREDTTPQSNQPFDTDLILCLDEAQRQADLRNHPVERELLLYIVHAILHCLGHNDHDDQSYQIMHAREDEILAALGVGATFAVEPQRIAEPGARSHKAR